MMPGRVLGVSGTSEAEWCIVQTDVQCTIFSVASAKYRDERPSDGVRTKQIRPFELAKSGSPSYTFWIACSMLIDVLSQYVYHNEKSVSVILNSFSCKLISNTKFQCKTRSSGTNCQKVILKVDRQISLETMFIQKLA